MKLSTILDGHLSLRVLVRIEEVSFLDGKMVVAVG